MADHPDKNMADNDALARGHEEFGPSVHLPDPSVLLRAVKRFDESRPSLPGEHWAVFATALALLRVAARSGSPWLALAAGASGLGLVWRALSGRDGLLRKFAQHQRPAD
ncbi:MAG: hypothetical protein C0453_01325 [Comamonadaceae bacterium]|nr:hypothetical protein [Comamonadaceae bacterium]